MIRLSLAILASACLGHSGYAVAAALGELTGGLTDWPTTHLNKVKSLTPEEERIIELCSVTSGIDCNFGRQGPEFFSREATRPLVVKIESFSNTKSSNFTDLTYADEFSEAVEHSLYQNNRNHTTSITLSEKPNDIKVEAHVGDNNDLKCRAECDSYFSNPLRSPVYKEIFASSLYFIVWLKDMMYDKTVLYYRNSPSMEGSPIFLANDPFNAILPFPLNMALHFEKAKQAGEEAYQRQCDENCTRRNPSVSELNTKATERRDARSESQMTSKNVPRSDSYASELQHLQKPEIGSEFNREQKWSLGLDRTLPPGEDKKESRYSLGLDTRLDTSGSVSSPNAP